MKLLFLASLQVILICLLHPVRAIPTSVPRSSDTSARHVALAKRLDMKDLKNLDFDDLKPAAIGNDIKNIDINGFRPANIGKQIKQITKKPAEKPPLPLVSIEAIDRYKELVSYSADAYCRNLTVGSRVGSDGIVLWNTGDGIKIQQVFIAYSKMLGSIVISHEGTNTTSIDSIENDISVRLSDPWTGLQFLGPGIKISEGFQEAWHDTSHQVVEQMQRAREKYPDAKIISTGHSLGASISVLGSMHLKHKLNVEIETVVFGMPRTGNKEFADAVDKLLPNQHHIVNYHDPIPHLPGKHIGFRQAYGEVWIGTENGDVVYDCAGQENPQCSDSTNPFEYDTDDHHGPYFGKMMDCTARPAVQEKRKEEEGDCSTIRV